jgi:hypothetical protein
MIIRKDDRQIKISFLNAHGYRERVYAAFLTASWAELGFMDNQSEFAYDPSKDTLSPIHPLNSHSFKIQTEATATLESIRKTGWEVVQD